MSLEPYIVPEEKAKVDTGLHQRKKSKHTGKILEQDTYVPPEENAKVDTGLHKKKPKKHIEKVIEEDTYVPAIVDTKLDTGLQKKKKKPQEDKDVDSVPDENISKEKSKKEATPDESAKKDKPSKRIERPVSVKSENKANDITSKKYTSPKKPVKTNEQTIVPVTNGNVKPNDHQPILGNAKDMNQANRNKTIAELDKMADEQIENILSGTYGDVKNTVGADKINEIKAEVNKFLTA